MALIIPIINSERMRLNRIIKKNLRDTLNPFEISENLFITQYRLPQVIAFRLIEDIRPFAQHIGSVPLEIQILSVLNFYASGSYQTRVGSDALNALSQPMISRYISRYTSIIVENLSPRYIRFPQSVGEITTTKQKFEERYNFPGILGVVDGTHVNLSALSLRLENAFINRKGLHSLNVQIVCDADMIITNVNARYPGSTHDSFVFGSSRLYAFVKDIYRRDPHEWNWLLGDSGYPLLPWLMNIIQNHRRDLTDAERNFNAHLSTIRQLIGRVIGILKVRFRCILGERKLRYGPAKAGQIVYACATLHNYLIYNRYDVRRDIDEDLLQVVIDGERFQENIQDDHRLAEAIRNELIDFLYELR